MSDVWEVEQKYIVAQGEHIVKRLMDMGATEIITERMIDTYLAHPCRDLRRTDEAFRMRCVGNEARVTYKGPRLAGTVKIRPEIELRVEASETAQWLQMFEALGFRPLASITKARRSFQLPCAGRTFSVALDEVESLGDFVEIELLVSNREDLPHAGSAIKSLGESLGLNQIQPKSYLSMMLAKLGLE